MFSVVFLKIIVAHFLAVASPGPDFILILNQSLIRGRKEAIISSLGVGLGILVHVAYCVLGVGLVISQNDDIFNIMKYIAGVYLIYLGVTNLKIREFKADKPERSSGRNPFIKGFLTNGLNPKATLFFLSLYTLVIPANTSLGVQIFYGVYMAFATAIWFTLLSVFLSSHKLSLIIRSKIKFVGFLMSLFLIYLGVSFFF